ncbi:HlyD family efflux transporter periplasmic adaptor subunit [uncultured Nonlabens sp.]|uniref:HlyD family efflux transporter periplasmic adaptor subunit n=1 Tax=uncultured Nonlabens sp. TaxID=859306 RepID=UPI0030DB8FCA|tara:strand:+ start:45 stop:1388 length:1344 start_codon:yes stop_codon:yes gene_type:complete
MRFPLARKINMPDQLKDIELRSEEVQEILTKVPSSMLRYGNALFLILIVLLLFISWWVKYPDIIVSQGIITTQVPPQKEYSKINSMIQHLLVVNDQEVETGELLAVLQNAANYKDVLWLEQLLDTVSYDKKYFQFPLDSLPILFLGDLEAPFAAFENAYMQYQLNKELQPFDNDAIANRSTRMQLQVQLRNTLSRKRIQKTELDFKKKELDRSKALFEKGVVSAQEYELKQLEYAQNRRAYQSVDASISQLRNQLSNTSSSLEGIKINRTKEELQLYKSLIQSFTQLKKAVRNYEQLYILRATLKGRLGFTQNWSENQQVVQGDLLFTVFPKEYQSYIAVLKTPVWNSGKLKVGQKTYLKLQNFPEAEFGVVEGKVSSISQVPDKNGFYYVQVALSDSLITSYQNEIKLYQETKVVAETVTEDSRLLERFFYQFKELFSRSGMEETG